MDSIPRIKKAVLVRKLNIAVDEESYEEYMRLKQEFGIDMPECLRIAFRAEIMRLRDLAESQSVG